MRLRGKPLTISLSSLVLILDILIGVSRIRTISASESPVPAEDLPADQSTVPQAWAAELAADPNAHPLSLQATRELVATDFPQYAEALNAITLPTISQHPDELEAWEVDQIVRHRAQPTATDQRLALYRWLYEESFGVNQNPGVANPPQLHGSLGMTPGGLISHGYPNVVSYGGHSIPQVARLTALEQSTVSGAMRQLLEVQGGTARGELTAVAGMVQHITRGRAPSSTGEIFEVARSLSEDTPHDERYDTVGYRFLKMLHAAPEMTEVVQDKELQARFVMHDANLTRAELLTRAWRDANRRLPGDSFPTEYTDEVAGATEQLLALRTHPEMQIFYTYASPSGYVNEVQATA